MLIVTKTVCRSGFAELEQLYVESNNECIANIFNTLAPHTASNGKLDRARGHGNEGRRVQGLQGWQC